MMALDFLWKRCFFWKVSFFWKVKHIIHISLFWKVKVFWWLTSTKSCLSRWWCHQKLLVFVGVEPIWQIIFRCFETTNWYVHWKKIDDFLIWPAYTYIELHLRLKHWIWCFCRGYSHCFMASINTKLSHVGRSSGNFTTPMRCRSIREISWCKLVGKEWFLRELAMT